MSELNEQVKLEIDNAFACQQSYALELRKSDYKRRIAVLDRFEQVFRASEEKIYKSVKQTIWLVFWSVLILTIISFVIYAIITSLTALEYNY